MSQQALLIIVGGVLVATGILGLGLALMEILGHSLAEEPFDRDFWVGWSTVVIPSLSALLAGGWFVTRKGAPTAKSQSADAG